MRRSGDSLMGRYFLYRVHPFSVRELQCVTLPDTEIQNPQKIDDTEFDTLFEFGGFPEPLLKQTHKFYHRWQTLRQEQTLQGDIRYNENIQDLAQLEVLAEHIKHQATCLVKYSELAKKTRVADTTIRRWIKVLENYYYCFHIKPWSKNLARTLVKEPKLYLIDWSIIENIGAKIENFVACHLLKAVHYWNDMGMGNYDLFYIRDKQQREVDFLITKKNTPWILIEVKKSAQAPLSKSLIHYQQQTKAPYAFQVAFDMPYVDIDCFAHTKPCIVSMKTLLSQLI